MKPYLLIAAAVFTTPPVFAGGFLDFGHLDWGVFLSNGYANSQLLPPKAAVTASVSAADTTALPNPGQPAAADSPRPVAPLVSPTGAPRAITPGVSP